MKPPRLQFITNGGKLSGKLWKAQKFTQMFHHRHREEAEQPPSLALVHSCKAYKLVHKSESVKEKSEAE